MHNTSQQTMTHTPHCHTPASRKKKIVQQHNSNQSQKGTQETKTIHHKKPPREIQFQNPNNV